MMRQKICIDGGFWQDESENRLPAETRELWDQLLDLREQAIKRTVAPTGGDSK